MLKGERTTPEELIVGERPAILVSGTQQLGSDNPEGVVTTLAGAAAAVHTLMKDKEVINIAGSDEYWISYIEDQLKNNTQLTTQQRNYYMRILRVHSMPDLTQKAGNPVNMLVQSILHNVYFRDFDLVRVPEIVDEYTTFDLFNFSKEHVARRPSDSYFIQKDDNDPHNSILLRPHTSVMWKYVMSDLGGVKKLDTGGKLQFLSSGPVSRVDDIDPTHHERFHQIDGLKITSKKDELITQDTLKEVLIHIIFSIFGDNVEYRFLTDNFPYTQESLQVEVMFEKKWLEVLGAGIVHPSVMEKLGLDASKYNGWAFGFGIERLAMALKKIPDIRLFWNEDPRITKQWVNNRHYEAVSNFPPVYKDTSFITPKIKFRKDVAESEKSGKIKIENESDLFAISGIVRDVAGDLVEEVQIVDMFENDKRFGDNNKSVCVKITFRSVKRTLTHEEINEMNMCIREKITNELGYILR